MVNGVSPPSSLSAFNVPDSRIRLLAENQELANARLLSGVGGSQSLQNNSLLSTSLLLNQLLLGGQFSSLGGFPASFLLSPSLMQFVLINNLTINFFFRDRYTGPSSLRYAEYEKLLRQFQGTQVGQGVSTINFFA